MSRYLLYRNAYSHANRAIEAGFPLEAIAIYESIMADRLESLFAVVASVDRVKLPQQTLGNLLQQTKLVFEARPDGHPLWIELDSWWNKRNSALHEAVKRSSENPETWKEWHSKTKSSASEGKKLCGRLTNETRKFRRWWRSDLNSKGKNRKTK